MRSPWGLAILQWHPRESPSSSFLYVSERGAALSALGFSRMIERAVTAAGLGIRAHARMLRYAYGLKVGNLDELYCTLLLTSPKARPAVK
jgi:hypothetical protein